MRTPFVLALLWCSLAFADRLVPELDAGRFGMLERELQLNREQTGMLRAARLAYVSELDLIREQRSAALSAAGQDRIEAALRGELILDRTERRSLQAAVRQAEAPFRRRAAQELDTLILTAAITLPEEAKSSAEESFRALRRESWLQTWGLGSKGRAGGGEGVDLLQLLDEALRPGGALAGGLREDWAPFLSDWSAEVDRFLRGPALDLADAFDRHAIAKLQGVGVAEAEALLARQLATLEGIHRRHAEALAQIIEASVDQTAGFRWMLSVYDATWPWMGIGTVRREALWIASTIQDQAVVDSALRSLARSENALQPLVQAVVDEARSRRDSEAKVLNPLLPPLDGIPSPARIALLSKTGAIGEVANETSHTLRMLLTKNQRLQMESDLLVGDRRRR